MFDEVDARGDAETRLRQTDDAHAYIALSRDGIHIKSFRGCTLLV